MYFEPNISSEFSFNSKFIEIQGSKLHYVDVGEGDPIVFVHGVPTSSYLWRNIIVSLMPAARCIALDLIGFGQSDKPDIRYSIQDHILYFNQFIESLKLKNITFVLHGWGSVIGFNYIAKNIHNVKAIAFYEAHVHPETDWNLLSLPVQQLGNLRKASNNIEKAILQDNYFMKKIFPMSMVHLPDKKVMQQYHEPFQTPQHRMPLLQYVYDLPLGDNKNAVTDLISEYSAQIKQTPLPKLMLYSVPGFLTPIRTVQWCRDNFSNLQITDLGEELHFAQETMPAFFGQVLYTWYSQIN